MDLHDYLRVTRKHARLIALCVLLALGAAAAVTFLTKPTYQAQVQVFVSTQSDNSNVSNAYAGAQFSQDRVTSYADIVNTPPVTSAVIRQLGLHTTPAALGKEITASAPLNTVLIDIDVKDRSPARAQAVANAVATQFTALVQKLETPLSGGVSPVKVSVVQPAALPTAPVSPRKKLNLALGLLVGLAVGFGAAVLRETLDRSVKHTDELGALTGAPNLGVIGFDPQAPRRPLVVHTDPRSPRAEAFRQLRTNLQFINVDHAPRSLVVTSSVPEEGKTTTACNLAITLAQAGLRVCLVEGDLRRPKAAEYLGLESAAGVTTVLVGRASLDEVVQPWGGGLLHLLGSGRLPPNPSELLASRGMEALIRDVEGRFDLVIIDAPPLLPVTDAAVLATLTTGALLVTRAGHTARDQVANAVHNLRNVGANLLGTVLNMVPTKGPDARYYGYGYGYSADAPQGVPPRHASTPRGEPAAVSRGSLDGEQASELIQWRDEV